MANGKKSFIAYCEWIETFEDLSNEDAGKLIKHLFQYVNDLNPITDDRLVRACFIPIKQTLKRDLKKYDVYISKQKENGKKGGRPKKTQKTQPFLEKPKKTDSVIVNDSVSEIIDKSITYEKKDFLKDWNELRLKHLNKPSFLNSLQRDSEENFKDLIKNYTREHFKFALVGLFKQKKLPNGNTSMQSNPRHFLGHFESYLTAYHDKNEHLYGKVKTENAL